MPNTRHEKHLRVLDHGGAWLVHAQGDRGGLLFPTRGEALGAAMSFAQSSAPSRVVVLSARGTVEHEFVYPAGFDPEQC
jgi:hypothetical protein